MNLPDFLVIGAEKCGTTTLYEDLKSHPEILIAEKESSTLCGGAKTAEILGEEYARLFRGAPSGVKLGEVSTRYAMLPDDPEAPSNAKTIAPNAKIIYIVRNPLDRVISHHHHDYGLGFVGPDIDEAVHTHPSLVGHTRYATQIDAWMRFFSRDQVRVVRFEDYVANRINGLAGLLAFIGVESSGGAPSMKAHNAASTMHIASGRWSIIAQNRLYRKFVRPMIGEDVRKRLTRAVLPKAPPRPDPPSAATLDHLVEALGPEVRRLADLLGTEPFWDLDVSRERHLAREPA